MNLAWAVDRMLGGREPARADILRIALLRDEATRILDEDRAMCRRIGENGAPLIPDGARILTHCNAGALATAGIGTALAAIYVAVEQGKRVEVFADETRPLLQGSRLTAWELERAGIPVTVLVDSAAASLMRDGAHRSVHRRRGSHRGERRRRQQDRNAARSRSPRVYHDVPFYVAAPMSTFDPSTRARSARSSIEQRGRRRSPLAASARRRRRADVARLQPRVRRDAGRAGHRDHHRSPRPRAAIRLYS